MYYILFYFDLSINYIINYFLNIGKVNFFISINISLASALFGEYTLQRPSYIHCKNANFKTMLTTFTTQKISTNPPLLKQFTFQPSNLDQYEEPCPAFTIWLTLLICLPSSIHSFSPDASPSPPPEFLSYIFSKNVHQLNPISFN